MSVARLMVPVLGPPGAGPAVEQSIATCPITAVNWLRCFACSKRLATEQGFTPVQTDPEVAECL